LRRSVETTDNNGQRWILARDCLSAFDLKRAFTGIILY
jgi:hypothetical protein